MRGRRAVALSLLPGLVLDDCVADAFAGSSRYGSQYRRPTVCTARDTEAVDTGGEPAFATGGAERVAELLAGESAGEGAVFFNRVGAMNRDLSVLMANVLAEERLRERLAGRRKTRNRRLAPPPPLQSSPADGVERHGAERNSWGVTALLRGALRRFSRRRLDGEGGAADLAGEQPSEGWRGGAGEEQENPDELVVLDAFAASGVRALRYLTEVPRVRKVVANDYDAAAVNLIRQAADLCGAGDKLETHRGDAADVMYAARAGGLGTYDIIDVDPFGCAAGFLDASVQAVTHGGLLCVTSTDMPILSGVQPEVAWARYGSVPTRSGYHHEMSLRILLYAISAAAGRHRRSIEPVLSVAIDHYVRVFVRVSRSPRSALTAAQEKTSYVLQSEACPSFSLVPVLPPTPTNGENAKSRARRRRRTEGTDSPAASPGGGSPQQPNQDGEVGAVASSLESAEHTSSLGLGGVCPETGGQMRMGGPIWTGPLHDEKWVTRALAMASVEGATPGEGNDRSPGVQEEEGGSPAPQKAGVAVPRPRLAAGARVKSLLRAVSQELPDVCLFYNLREMFATLGFRDHPRREQVMGALEAAGFRTSGMHKEPLAIKTDAPDAAVWDVLRCWARDNPQPTPVRAAGLAILGRGTQLIADADFQAGRAGVEGGTGEGAAAGRGKGGFLHAHNPEQDWGPLARRSVMPRGEGGEEAVQKGNQAAASSELRSGP